MNLHCILDVKSRMNLYCIFDGKSNTVTVILHAFEMMETEQRANHQLNKWSAVPIYINLLFIASFVY